MRFPIVFRICLGFNRVAIFHADLPALTTEEAMVYLQILAQAVRAWGRTTITNCSYGFHLPFVQN